MSEALVSRFATATNRRECFDPCRAVTGSHFTTIRDSVLKWQAAGDTRGGCWERAARVSVVDTLECISGGRSNVTRLQAILAGHGRDRLPARPTRSGQDQGRLDDQERAQLLAAYNQGVLINDLAEMVDLSHTAVMANLTRLGAESRHGIVERRIEEVSALYLRGWSLAKISQRYGVYPSTVRDALLIACIRIGRRILVPRSGLNRLLDSAGKPLSDS